MSTAERPRQSTGELHSRPPTGQSKQIRPLHRIAIVRRQHGLSARSLANRMDTTVAAVQQQEAMYADLLLSELYKWQAALDVPIAELLVEPGPTLSPNVRRRAALLRMMKTIRSMERHANTQPIRTLVEGLADQLIEMMPELTYVDGWPTVGKRRTRGEIAPIEERILPSAMFDDSRPERIDRG